MKKINDTLEEFHKGIIGKSEFISKMYERHHAKIFEYTQHISKTNIKSIEIMDDKIIFTTRDRGARFVCIPGDFRATPVEILNFYDYEKNYASMIDRLTGDNDTFFDIGANLGWYAINLATSRREAKIHCFEPIYNTYSYLQDNIKLNAAPNITAHNFGFSRSAGELDFYYYREGTGNSSLANLSSRRDVQILKCKVETLDDFCEKNKITVDVIKCDVEGAELMVFQGGLQIIKYDRPIVFSEILRKWSAKFNYNPNEIFDLFKSFNYRSFSVSDAGLKEFFNMDDQTVDTNFVFLHAEKHAEKIRQFNSP